MIDLTAAQRRDLMEIIDDRHDRGSIILASQLPVDRWHATIGDPTYADAILDRLVHNAIRLPLKGRSLREPNANGETSADEGIDKGISPRRCRGRFRCRSFRRRCCGR